MATQVATGHGSSGAARERLALLASAVAHVALFALLVEMPGRGTAHEPVPARRTIAITVRQVSRPIVHSAPPPPSSSPAAPETRPRRAMAAVKNPQERPASPRVEPPREVVAPLPPHVEPTKPVVAPLLPAPSASPKTLAAKQTGAEAGGPGGGATGAGTGGVPHGVPGGAGSDSAVQPVIGPSYAAAYLHNPAPRYPALARRMKLQGTTTVRVLVSPEGHPQRVAVETSSGVDLLDEAALEAVREWSFVPAKQGHKAIAAEVNVPIRFRLTGATVVLPDGDSRKSGDAGG